jgi:hypothetical protein
LGGFPVPEVARKPFAPGGMMRLPPVRNQRLYVRHRARHHIRLAEIVGVGQQRFGPAKLFRKVPTFSSIGRECLNHPCHSIDVADWRRAPGCSANWGAMPIASPAQPPF